MKKTKFCKKKHKIVPIFQNQGGQMPPPPMPPPNDVPGHMGRHAEANATKRFQRKLFI